MHSLISNLSRALSGKSKTAPFGFHGGLELAPNKRALASGITDLEVPPTLVLPLINYAKQTLAPLVSAGDKVERGQLLAEGVIAPTSGVIESIEEHESIHPDSLLVNSIVLQSDGLDSNYPNSIEEDKLIAAFHSGDTKTATAILDRFGLAGLGGAGFPTATKLLATTNQVHTVIINAAECEPEIACDEALMQQDADSICKGIEVLSRISPNSQLILAIEDSKSQAIEQMRDALQVLNLNVELRVIPTLYPTGAESPLIECLTGKHIGHHEKPIEHGIVCINVSTVYALWQAVNGRPLDSRIISLGGQSMPNPCNVRVRFGTPVSFILERTGNASVIDAMRVRAGGPLSGFDLNSLSVAITAKTNCILAEPLIEDESAQACIRCGLCADVCPAKLLPQQLHWYAVADDFKQCERLNLDACIECGCCDLVCPASIKLTETFRYAKSQSNFFSVQQQKAAEAEQRFAARELREKQRKIEKVAAIERRKQSIKTNDKSNDENIKAALDRARAKRRPKKDQ